MSEVKNIPRLRFTEFNDEWITKSMNELGEFKNGINKSKSDFGFGFPFVNLMDVFGKTLLDNKIELELVNVSEKELLNYDLIKGDVLFIRSSVKKSGVGETIVVSEDIDKTVYSGFLIRFRENKSSLHYSFKNYCFWTTNFRKQVINLSTTSANTNINQESLNKVQLTFPSLPEQQKIADFLTAVDKRIELLEKKKTLLETYKKGVMKKIFNQEIRFKDDDGNDYPDWEEKRLGDITNKKSSNISANSIEQIEGDFIVYGATGELKKIDFYEMDRPYISIVKDGSGVGRVNMCKPFSSVLGTLDMLINNELSDLDFVFQFLSKTSFLKYVTGSSIPHIYYKDYSKLKMLVPTVEEQVKISKFLSSIDNQIELLETQIDKSKTWKKGLLQKMFV